MVSCPQPRELCVSPAGRQNAKKKKTYKKKPTKQTQNKPTDNKYSIQKRGKKIRSEQVPAAARKEFVANKVDNSGPTAHCSSRRPRCGSPRPPHPAALLSPALRRDLKLYEAALSFPPLSASPRRRPAGQCGDPGAGCATPGKQRRARLPHSRSAAGARRCAPAQCCLGGGVGGG